MTSSLSQAYTNQNRISEIPRQTEHQSEETPLAQITQVQPPRSPAFSNCFDLRAYRDTAREVFAFRPGVGATLSGLGMMVDMYDVTAMNVALNLLESTYGEQSATQAAMMTSSVLVGSVVGQLGFGAYSDKIGRKNLTILVSALTLAGSLGSALAVPLSKQSPSSVYYTITAMRFILGLGVGGEYPLSASNTVEQTPIKHSNTALAYAMMILNSGAALAGGVLTTILKTNPDNDDVNWRLGLGFGAALSAVTLALRVSLLEESPVFMQQPAQPAQSDMRIDLEANEFNEVAQQEVSLLLQVEPTALQNHVSLAERLQTGLNSPWLKPVAGAAITWFLYDVSAFGVGMYSSDLLADKGDNLGAAQSLFFSNAMALPFSILSMMFINDRLLGRQNIQTLGLGGMAAMLSCMAITETYLTQTDGDEGHQSGLPPHMYRMLLTGFYTAYNSFDALGPGTSTFAFSSEIFPARLRGTLHGIAAASGKIGGALGAMSFPFLKKYLSTEGSLMFASGVCALGSLLTKLLLPNYTNSHLHQLEEIGDTASDKELVQMIYDKNGNNL